MLYKNAEQLIGKTPLTELTNIEKMFNLKSKIYAKLEYLNPAGSAKDRVALEMINNAEEKGLLKKGSVIIEPTSGNTGIGLALIGAVRGYRTIIVMPDTMSKERILMISAYGAEVALSDGKKGMAGAVELAKKLKNENPGAFIPDQFANPVNPLAHYKTTGPEIWEDTDGNVDFFVAGVGTGGTISGVGKFLREKKNSVKIIAVEPESSPLLSKGKAGTHKIQGIGANFVPKALDTNIYDEILTVSNEDSYKYTALIGKKEGILVGISSGAALAAAIEIAKNNENKNIVVLFPDSGDRYFSTGVFG